MNHWQRFFILLKGLMICVFLVVLGTAERVLLPSIINQVTPPSPETSVLGTSTQTASVLRSMGFKIPVHFKDNLFIDKTLTVTGNANFNGDVFLKGKILNLNSLNLGNIATLTVGQGISSTGDSQNPVLANTGVLSFQGLTGVVTLTQGSGITVNGTTITNSGVTSFGGQSGAVSLTAGTGITVSGTTISNSLSSNLVTNGIVYSTDGSTITGLTTPSSAGYILQSNGSGVPIWSTTINLTGILTDGTYAGANAVLYAAPTTGQFTTATTTTGSQCLLSNTGSSGIPAWGACALGSNLWQLNNGALSPAATSNDLLLGGTSTSSAIFGIINIAGGTPTATVSSNMSLQVPTGSNPSELFNILNGGSLNFQTSTGGDTGLISRLYISNKGNVGIGTTTPGSALEVKGDIVSKNTGSQGYVYSYNTTGSNYIRMSHNGTNAVLETNTGALGLISAGYIYTINQQYFRAQGNTFTNYVGVQDLDGSGGQITNSFGNLTLATDQTTGINKTGSNTFDIFTASSSGNTKLVINNAGNVGIGTTTPSYPLDVTGVERINGTSNETLYVQSNNAVGTSIALDNSTAGAHNYEFYVTGSSNNPGFFGVYDGTAGNTPLAINGASGNISIGTAGSGQFGWWSDAHYATSGSFDTGLSRYAAGAVQITNGGSGFGSLYAGTTGLGTTAIGNAELTVNQPNSAGDIFSASQSGNTKFVINNNGNVGIGTTTPSTKLAIVDPGTGGLTVYSPNQSKSIAISYDGTNVGISSVNQQIILENNITSLGWFDMGNNPINNVKNINIGSGIYTNLAALDVRANSGINPIASISGKTSFASLVVDNSGVGDIFTASSSGLTRFVITQAGNVGVGTSTPGQLLEIASPIGQVAALGLKTTDGNGDRVLFGYNNSYNFGGSINYNWSMTQAMEFRTGGINLTDDKLLITNTGLLGVNVPAVTPLASLDVRQGSGGNSGTLAIASVSGKTSFAALVVDNSGVGDLFTASTAGLTRFRIDNGGNTSIFGASLCVKSNNNLPCGAGVAGNIYASSGSIGAADVAENYVSSQTLETGDLVIPANDGNNMAVVKTTGSYQQQLIGVVSTDPGVTLNSDAKTDSTHKNLYPIALNGRVPVKVSTENGAISVGDFLTSSSVPGVAMKATKEGTVIGKALENFDGTTGSTGKILVYVTVSWANPTIYIASDGNLSVNGQTVNNSSVLAATSSIPSQPTLNTANSVTSNQFNQLAGTVSQLQSQIASQAAQLGKIDDLSNQLADLEKTVNLIQAIQGTSSSSAVLGASITNEDMTVEGKLNVLGKTLLSDVGITGQITAGLLTINGMDTLSGTASATINSLSGPLKLQSLGLGGVDVLNGKVTIDTNGNIVTTGDITAKTIHADEVDTGMLKIKEDNTAASTVGEATIPSGQTSIEIKTTAVTDTSKIFVTSEIKGSGQLYVTSKTAGKSFKVELDIPLKKDDKFNWWVLN